MTLNPEYVEKLASDAFWNFVYENSLQETGFPTETEDIPKSLWSRQLLISSLIKDGIISENESFEEELINTLYHAVAERIVDQNQKGQNILGVIYTEDFQFCKEPNFRFNNLVADLKSDANEICGYATELKGKYLKEGDFLLRTPLPSGILLKSDPQENRVYIPDTSKALNFQKTMILLMRDKVSLPVNEYGYKYFVSGVFYVPTQRGPNEKWIKLIPNIVCVMKGFEIFSSNREKFEGEIVHQPLKKNIFKKILDYFN